MEFIELLAFVGCNASRETLLSAMEKAIAVYKEDPCDRAWDGVATAGCMIMMSTFDETDSELMKKLQSTDEAVKMFQNLYGGKKP